MTPHKALVAVGVLLAVASPCTCGMSALLGAACSIAALAMAARARSSLAPALAGLALNLGVMACTAAIAMFAYRQAVATPARVRTLANRLSVAGFWNDYRRDELVASASDQGPWGGWRAIHWRSATAGAFERESIVDFAREKGWELVNERELSAQEISSWRAGDALIFPLGHRGLDAPGASFSDSTWSRFDRRIVSDCTLLAFTTGIVSIAPGSDDACEVNGYVLLSADGTAFSVYHLWGE